MCGGLFPKMGTIHGQFVMTLWQGRFDRAPAEELLTFTESLSFDQRLALDDVEGSAAHVRGLARVGVITEQEAGIVLAAIERARVELESGSFVFVPTDED